MADSGRWFKLWCAAVHDPDLDNLDIADFGRWAKLGTHIKEHGTNGVITLSEPSRSILAMMQIDTFFNLIECIKKFPNVTVSLETNTSVSYTIIYENWHKYQGDFSTHRVQKFRAKNKQNETPKKRGEEKRGEENKNKEKEEEKESVSSKQKKENTSLDFIAELKKNPAYTGIDIDRELSKMDAWFLTPKGKGRKKTHGFILKWLNKVDVPINYKQKKDEPYISDENNMALKIKKAQEEFEAQRTKDPEQEKREMEEINEKMRQFRSEAV